MWEGVAGQGEEKAQEALSVVQTSGNLKGANDEPDSTDFVDEGGQLQDLAVS